MSRRRSAPALALALAAATSALPATGQAPPPAAPDLREAAVRAAERELWLPGESRALRSWLVRGAGSAVADEGSLAPSGPGDGWAAYVAWTDQIELSAPAAAAAAAPVRYVYAAATVTRAESGAAELALGSRSDLRLWVNGERVGEVEGADFLARDRIRIPIRLRAGENRILLRAAAGQGPARLTLRLLAPNQPVADAFAPSLAQRPDGRVAIRSHFAAADRAAHIAVFAAGGRLVAEADAPATFETADWPDGPYEARVTARDSFGDPLTAWLPWYKGDPAPAARTLLARAAAATGGDARSGHLRMLVALLADRAGVDLAALADHPDTVHSVLMEAAELELGEAARLRPSGFVRLAWIDEVDGSTQFCRAYLPPGYDGIRAWPTILYLHGYNPANPPYTGFWRVDQRHDAIADRGEAVWIEVHGRANSQYVGIGERDTLRCLAEAQRQLRVDPDRVYLNGESMGGAGTWLIGARHPHLFAAIVPVFGGWDYRLQPGGGFGDPAADRPMERWQAESHSSFAGAEQLINTPVFVHHGDADAAVDVRFSRHIVQRLQRWGYDIGYREYPGWGHEDLHYREAAVDWMLRHRRPAAPRRVRIRSIDLDGAEAWWLRVDGAERPLELIEADAEMVEPGLLRLDTRNVAALTLTPPPSLRRAGPLRVVWNGRRVETAVDRDGRARLALAGAPRGPRLKRPGLGGGLANIFTTPFVIVAGTSSADPEMRRLTRAKAEALAAVWQAWQHVPPRLVDDTELTADMERSLSLVLIGGPDANAVARRLARRLPLRIAGDSVTVDGRRFAARDAVVDLVYPSPLAADRYVMVVAGTSPAGLDLWDPAGYRHPLLGTPTNFYDWTLRDGRAAIVAAGPLPERTWIASGVFDQSWRRDDRWTFLGAPGGGARAEASR